MQYDLVFEGGGAKGMVLVGAYEEFVRKGCAPARVMGTSAGAITAALVAAGYTPAEMLAALNEEENGKQVFAQFLSEPPTISAEDVATSTLAMILEGIQLKLPFNLDSQIDKIILEAIAKHKHGARLIGLLDRGGIFSAAHFERWMKAKLDQKTPAGVKKFGEMTLEEFYAARQIDISLIASNTTSGRILVLNHRTAPKCPLLMAVRMSMNIPFVWEEVIWQAEWGDYRGKQITGHAIVDGGMISNFAIELFISDRPQVTAVMGTKQANPVLGMLIDDAQMVTRPARARGMIEVDVDWKNLAIVHRIGRLMETAMTAHDKMVMDEFSHLVVRLPAGGYGVIDFDVPASDREALVQAGRDAMRQYFVQHPPESAATPRGAASEGVMPSSPAADRTAMMILEGS